MDIPRRTKAAPDVPLESQQPRARGRSPRQRTRCCNARNARDLSTSYASRAPGREGAGPPPPCPVGEVMADRQVLAPTASFLLASTPL